MEPNILEGFVATLLLELSKVNPRRVITKTALLIGLYHANKFKLVKFNGNDDFKSVEVSLHYEKEVLSSSQLDTIINALDERRIVMAGLNDAIVVTNWQLLWESTKLLPVPYKVITGLVIGELCSKEDSILLKELLNSGDIREDGSFRYQAKDIKNNPIDYKKELENIHF